MMDFLGKNSVILSKLKMFILFRLLNYSCSGLDILNIGKIQHGQNFLSWRFPHLSFSSQLHTAGHKQSEFPGSVLNCQEEDLTYSIHAASGWYHMFYMMLHQHETLCSREFETADYSPHSYNGWRECFLAILSGYPRHMNVYSEPQLQQSLHGHEMICRQSYFPLNILKKFLLQWWNLVLSVVQNLQHFAKKSFCFNLQIMKLGLE